MIRIFLLYALSGFVSLGYQVAWFRIFTDWFGSTNLTFALVVSNFIGGLGVGALLSSRIAAFLGNRLRLLAGDRMRVYGLVEILVGSTVLLTVLARFIPADLWGGFPYHLRDGIWVQSWLYRATQVGVAAGCVFVPCVLMGVTFPLICSAFLAAPNSGRLPSLLYAWNTLGACLGVLACQFVLLPLIGHGSALWCMVGLNVLLGSYFLLSGGAARAGTDPPAVPGPGEAGQAWPRSVVLACALLSGLLAGALEGDMFKRISFIIEATPGATMSFISFWAILAIFFASTIAHSHGLTFTHIKVGFVVAFIYVLCIWRFHGEIIAWVQAAVPAAASIVASASEAAASVPARPAWTLAGTRSQLFPSSLLQLLIFVGLYVFPPYMLVSLLLPHVCNRVQMQRRHIGMAYGLNTLAFCGGLIGFTLLAPRVNIFFSLKLFIVMFLIGVTLLTVILPTERLSWWPPAAAVVALVMAWAFVPRDFDKRYFPPDSRPAALPVSALKSDGAQTTFVVTSDEHAYLYFGRLSMSGTNFRSQAYMRLMAHFPLLLQRDPQRALLICFGVGNTAAAIAAHDSIERIDVVDLNANVFETAPEFAQFNDNVIDDPRLHLIHDDGRNYLRFTSETYDLITSEPPPPMAAGVYRLYSREYYQAALRRLAPTGMMTQWLPVYQMGPEAVDLVLATFLEVFPHALAFTGYSTEFILIGSRENIDLARLETRFRESTRVVADLAKIGVDTPLSLVARIVQGESALQRYRQARVISDQHNDLEHMFWDPMRHGIISYDPVGVLEDIDAESLACGRALAEIVNHLGRLRYHAHGFPFETLSTVQQTAESNIELAGVDWLEIGQQEMLHRLALDAGRSDLALRHLDSALALAPDQPELLLKRAQLGLVSGEYAQAIPDLQRFGVIEPDDALGHYSLGVALMNTGQAADALVEFGTASRLLPGWAIPLGEMAWILAAHPQADIRDPERTRALAERAVELTHGQDANVLDTLAVACAAGGDFEEAVEAVQAAIGLSAGDADVNRTMLNRHRSAFEEGRAVLDPSLVAGR